MCKHAASHLHRANCIAFSFIAIRVSTQASAAPARCRVKLKSIASKMLSLNALWHPPTRRRNMCAPLVDATVNRFVYLENTTTSKATTQQTGHNVGGGFRALRVIVFLRAACHHICRAEGCVVISVRPAGRHLRHGAHSAGPQIAAFRVY